MGAPVRSNLLACSGNNSTVDNKVSVKDNSETLHHVPECFRRCCLIWVGADEESRGKRIEKGGGRA